MKLIFATATLLLLFPPLYAQQIAALSSVDPPLPVRSTIALPDAPVPTVDLPGQTSTQAPLPASPKPQQSKQSLGIVPSFRVVDADTLLPPQTAKEKLSAGLQDSFYYSAFILAGAKAGIRQASDSYPAFRQGAAGYGRYYWHTFADQTDENLWVESILPTTFHEDSRYYVRGHGNTLKRAGYALSRAIVTKTDSGGQSFNFSEAIGSGAAAGISSTYYPGQYRTWTKTGQRWLSNVVFDGATFVVEEFWSDVNRAVFRHKD